MTERASEKKRFRLRAVANAMIVLGLIPIAGSGYQAFGRWKLNRYGIEALGIVVSLESLATHELRYKRLEVKNATVPIVEFDHQGQKYRARGPETFTSSIRIGDRVTVRYLLSDPESTEVLLPNASQTLPSLMVTNPLAAALFGLVMLSFAWILRRDARKL